MTLRWQIEPMSRWPYSETRTRKPNPFTASWPDTLNLLETEVHLLDGVGGVAIRVVTDSADIRRDGMLRARADVRHPGVAISFATRKHGSLTFHSDRYVPNGYRGYSEAWRVNVRGIALSLEALRAVNRHGVAELGEQYTGWRAIGSSASALTDFASADEALDWLAELTNLPRLAAPIALLRRAQRDYHPDRTGRRDLWDRVDSAKKILELSGLLGR